MVERFGVAMHAYCLMVTLVDNKAILTVDPAVGKIHRRRAGRIWMQAASRSSVAWHR